MTYTAAAREHQELVSQRAILAKDFQAGKITAENFEIALKRLDKRIGHLAQVHNPRIAAKAKAWLNLN